MAKLGAGEGGHGIRGARTGLLGEAEVGDLHPALAVEEDVGGFDIAVDDAVVVGVGEGVEDVGGDVDGLLLGEFPAVVLEVLVDVHAIDELHDEVELAVRGFPEVVDRDDRGVVEVGHRLRLALEACDEVHLVLPPEKVSGRSLMATVRFSFAWRPR